MPELHIIEVDFLTSTQEQWYDLLSARTDFIREGSPADPVPTFEDQRLFLSEIPTLHDHVVFWLLYNENQDCVGYCAIQHPKPENPDYEMNKNRIYVEPVIRPSFRRQGFGKRLLQPLLHYARAVGADWLQWDTSFESGRLFSQKIEAIEAGRQCTNRLVIKEVDWDLMRTWISEGKSTNPNVNLIRFTNLPEPTLLKGFCNLVTEINTLQPRDDLIGVEFTLTPEGLKTYARRLKSQSMQRIIICAQEDGGELNGMTDLIYNESNSELARISLTGVRQAFQGRGLGKWLKAAMLVALKQQNLEVEYVDTENFNSNQAMLSINDRMGFKLHKQLTFYKVEVNKLGSSLTMCSR